MTTTFAELGVPAFICDGLSARGIEAPFEIQKATAVDALAGRDVCGRAPTGSGKTLAFGVPTVANVAALGASRPGQPQGLILAPTRELAEQINAELRSFSGNVKIDAVYGGVGYGKQLRALDQGVDILVACPGRLEDLIQRRDVDLSQVKVVVLDEADRMADMGFMPAVRRLLDQTNPGRQTVLFSATLDGDIAKLTRDYQNNPVRHEVGEETPDITSADHRFWKVDRPDRNRAVEQVVNAAWPTVIFTRTRHGADRLAKQLGKIGIIAAPIHGGRSQNQRNRALDAFTTGRAHALVATDVAARGIHVDGVSSVIHYDPPEDHKAYVHRSGRTARAGASGIVVSLVQDGQTKEYRQMGRKIGLKVEVTPPTLDEMPEGAKSDGRELAPALPEQERSPGGGNGGKRSGGRYKGRGTGGHGRGGNGRGGHGRGGSRRGRDDRRDDRHDDRRGDGRGDGSRGASEGRRRYNEDRPARAEGGHNGYRDSGERSGSGNEAGRRRHQGGGGGGRSDGNGNGGKRRNWSNEGRGYGAKRSGGRDSAGAGAGSGRGRSGRPRPANRKSGRPR